MKNANIPQFVALILHKSNIDDKQSSFGWPILYSSTIEAHPDEKIEEGSLV
jgi:hypothetical protein